MSTAPPLSPSPPLRQGPLFGNFLEAVARFPLRLLQFPMFPFALAGVASLIGFSAYTAGDAWSESLRTFSRGIAIVFGVAALLAGLLWRAGEKRWSGSILFSSGYVRQLLIAAMLWQIVAGGFVLYSLGPWLDLAHALFENAGGGDRAWMETLRSWYAAFAAVAIYFCPGILAVAAAAPIAVGVATIPAAWRRSPTLPRLLLVGALVQTAYWGGAALSLDLLEDILRPVLQRMESYGVEETLRQRPELLEGIDPEKDRPLLAYLTQPFHTGRPAVQQLGWLLVAPWIFVPAVFVRRGGSTQTRPTSEISAGSS